MSVVLVGVGTLLLTQAAPEHNVQFIVFCSTDSCTAAEGNLTAPADYIPKWYGREVGRPYNVNPNIIRITGTQTAAAYRNGPSTTPISNILGNVNAEISSRFSPTTKIVALLGFGSNSGDICGIGYIGGNLSVSEWNAQHCKDTYYISLAHELGHNFGLEHTNPANCTLMDSNGGCHPESLDATHLDGGQAQTLRASSEWFVAGNPPPAQAPTSIINGYKVDQSGQPSSTQAAIANVPIEYTCCTLSGNSNPQSANPYSFGNLPRGNHQISINKSSIPSGWTVKYALCWDDGTCPAQNPTDMTNESSRYTLVLDTTNHAVAHLWFHFTQTAPPPPSATAVTSYLLIVGQQETNPNRKGCIDVYGNIKDDGTKIQLYDCVSSAENQQWAFFSDKTVRSKASGKCLDVKGYNTTGNGIDVQLYTCANPATANQQWVIDSNKPSICLASNTNKCLDARGPSNANSTQIQTYDWVGGTSNLNQRWIHGGSTSVSQPPPPPPPSSTPGPATVTPACSGTNSVATVAWNKDSGGGQYYVLMGYGAHSHGGWANYNIPNSQTSIQIPNSAAGSGSSLTYDKSDYWIVLNYNRTGQEFYTDFKAKNCTATDTTPPSKPGTPSLNGTATTTSIPIKWGASSDNVGVTSYDVIISGGTSRTTNVGNVTSYTVSGLTAGTSYTFKVVAHDAAGYTTASDPFTTSTANTPPPPPPSAPPAPTSTTITSTTTTSITFRWNAPTDTSQVRNYVAYVQPSGAGAVAYGPIYGTTASIGNLTPGKAYTVWAVSQNSSNVVSSDSPHVSTTLPTSAPSDTTAPSAPGKPVASNVKYNSVTLNWTAASDNVGVTKYAILRSDTNGVIGWSTTTSFVDTSVKAGSTVQYKVFAGDAAGNYTGSPISDPIRIPTPPTADTVKPSVPTNFSATAISNSQINLSWSPSTDNIGVTGYDIYRNNAKIASRVTSTNFGDTGLVAGTQYTYYVVAYDAAGNAAASSPAVTITAPNAPTNLTVTSRGINSGGSTVSLSWQSDGVGVSKFYVYRNGNQVTSVDSSQKSFTDTGLSGNTQYTYYVRAFNTNGLGSAQSNSVSTTTCYKYLYIYTKCPA